MNLPKKYIVLFDGVCNLCNSSVQLILKYDFKDHFLFTPITSQTGQFITQKFNIDTTTTDSIILYTPKDKVYFKSTAALKIACKLSITFKLLGIFFIVPNFIRNYVYDCIAKHRYKWFGKKDACIIPTPELKAKFLD